MFIRTPKEGGPDTGFRKVTLIRLQHQYQLVDQLLEGLVTVFVQKCHRPDKWSIHQNLAHLGRYQEIFEERIKAILTKDEPVFDRYRADDDPEFLKWCNKDTATIVEQTIEHREELASRLMQLDPHELQRVGLHPKLGRLNVTDWTEFFLLHEAHHLYSIFWLKHEFS